MASQKGDFIVARCDKCSRDTRQEVVKVTHRRECISYDGGGGDYEHWRELICRCACGELNQAQEGR